MGDQDAVKKNDVEQTKFSSSSSMIQRLGKRKRRVIFSVAEKDNEQYSKYE